MDRRRFLGYVVGGATLVAAADLVLTEKAMAAVPTPPQPSEVYDLNDALTDAARPTANLITVTINEDGTASFALPRSENGQGVVTSSAMLIAEELGLPVDKVNVTLADARPELVFNQLTGGSNTTISTFTPIRVAAAIAMGAMLDAAAIALGDSVELLKSKNGVITAPDGSSITYGELATLAASPTTRAASVVLKDESEFTVIGTPQDRTDARDAVTGRKTFTNDLQVKGALPTMVCRAPTLNGTPRRVRNRRAVLDMPGVTHVATIPTGVAVRAATFGQCIDAVRALKVDWNDGPVAGQSDADILSDLRAAEVPLPALPDNPLAEVLDADFTFYFRSNSPLDTNSAIADVREDRAEIWAGLKTPIVAQQEIAQALGMPQDAVTVHVVQGGGSFGRRLFFDYALEAAQISRATKKPVKLMWHRADDARAGLMHPMATSRIQAAYAGEEVLAFNQAHTSVETDYGHGLGELFSAIAAKLPTGNQGYAQNIWYLTQEVPYNFGEISQTLTETDERFNTSSMRNIYSPDVRTANELVIDMLAKKMDPLAFRLKFCRNDRVRAALEKVAEVGNWGRRMPAGTAQGIAVHKEYKGASACLAEIDCRPSTARSATASPAPGSRGSPSRSTPAW